MGPFNCPAYIYETLHGRSKTENGAAVTAEPRIYCEFSLFFSVILGGLPLRPSRYFEATLL